MTDFSKYDFAIHPDGRIAARFDNDTIPWRTSGPDGWYSDEEMDTLGYEPVVPVLDERSPLDLIEDAWDGALQVSQIPSDALYIERVVWADERKPDTFNVRVNTSSYGCHVEEQRKLSRSERRVLEILRPAVAKELQQLIDAGTEINGDTRKLADRLAENGVTIS